MPKSQGFGLISSDAELHFIVSIPKSKKDDIVISDSLGVPKVILSRIKWEMIADEVKAYFNQRLRAKELNTAQWKQKTIVSKLLGKELILLCWGIEDADVNKVPTAIRNWLGLAPEERWWLFTMTNATTGHAIKGKNKGWRKAIRYALSENTTSEDIIPLKDVNQISF